MDAKILEKIDNPMPEIFITIPSDYIHDKQLAKFKEKHGVNFSEISIDDRQSQLTKVRLIPGKEYKVVRYPLVQARHSMLNRELLQFLNWKNALLVGPQGLSVAYDLAPDHFRDKTFIEVNDPEHAYRDLFGSYNTLLSAGELKVFRHGLCGHVFTDMIVVAFFDPKAPL